MTNEKMLEVLRKGKLKELENALIENIREEIEKGEDNMIKLTKIFDLLGNDTFVSIKEGEKELYSGECGKCTRDIWRCAYVKGMRFDIHLERYVIRVRYM